MSNPTPNDLNLDKSQWVRTRLGDLACDVNDRVANPSEGEHNRFVGLEHFVSGDLKIKAWQTTDGLVSAAKAFKSGDVLFARRNAYLKRASMVDFDGVCSGDAFVLREDYEKVVPGYLAFVMNSRALWKHAIQNAAGTMSKRVKWRDLANYEFLLPPKDQQAKLAELLWAADGVIEADQYLLRQLEKNRQTQREKLLNDVANGKSVELGDISKLQGGGTFRSKDATTEGAKWLKIANVGFDEIKWDEESFLPNEFTDEYPNYVLNPGDIVMALTRPILGDRLKVARLQDCDSGALLNQRVGRIVISGPVESEFLYEHLRSRSFLLKMKKELQGTDPPNISNKMYENYQVVLPDLNRQADITRAFRLMNSSFMIAETRAQKSKALRSKILGKIFV